MKVKSQKQLRIQVSLWAFAYEIMDDSLVPDHKFDSECAKIDVNEATDSPEMDFWFRNNFQPYTGSWIHRHPHLGRLEQIYNSIKDGQRILEAKSLKSKKSKNNGQYSLMP